MMRQRRFFGLYALKDGLYVRDGGIGFCNSEGFARHVYVLLL
jgi:hypothetical protein